MFHFLNHLVSWVFPKSKKIWVYGEWFGDKFCDNSSYAFNVDPTERGRCLGVRKIWITKNRDIVKHVRGAGRQCYYAYSFMGLYYQARAKVFFCSVNSKDFCFSSLTPRVIFFQLWHGLPLKKIGFDVAGRGKLKRLVDFLRSLVFDKYSYIVSPSSDFDEIFCSAFRVSADKIIRSHLPRCDGLFLNDGCSVLREVLGIKTRHIIFYLPTHRVEGRAPEKIRGFIEDVKSLDVSLKELDVTLVVKPHYYELGNFEVESFGNVRVVKDLPVDLYRSLACSSAIITDYSSVALDYCITGKPIFYYIPDLSDYLKDDRETYFEYDSLLSGYSADVESLKCELEKYFVQGIFPAKIKIDLPPLGSNAPISDRFQAIAEMKVFGGVHERCR